MSSLRRFQDKIDVLDLIISILKDHEKNLSDFVDKMDAFIKRISVFEKDTEKGVVSQREGFTPGGNRCIVSVKCKRWSDFRDVSMGAPLVAFELRDSGLYITSVSDRFIFKYLEKIPDTKGVTFVHLGKPGCRKVLSLNPISVRRWLSDELKVPENRIIEGDLFTS